MHSRHAVLTLGNSRATWQHIDGSQVANAILGFLRRVERFVIAFLEVDPVFTTKRY